MERTTSIWRTIILALCLLLCQTVTALSQINRIGDFIKAGQEDAETLTKAYLKPLPSGVGGALNTGWFNSASPHQTLGFDIQIRGALAVIPSSDQRFDLTNLDLQKVRPVDENNTLSPTAGGDDSPGPEVVVEDNGDEVAQFKLPQGSGFNYVPSPMIQASVGLIKSTDVIVRYVPEVKIGKYGRFQMRGFGLKHSLSQWLPALFPLDISIMAGYNRIDINGDLNLDPDPDAAPDPTYTGNYDNQEVKTNIDTFTAKLLVGKELPFISVYGGVGYETSSMNLALTGDYPVSSSIGGVESTQKISDPFSYSADGSNDFSLTGGLKFKLLFFHVFGEYTLAKYPVANAGIGFSFR